MAAQELLDQVEIKDLLQQIQIVGRGVNDLYLEWTVCLGADG